MKISILKSIKFLIIILLLLNIICVKEINEPTELIWDRTSVKNAIKWFEQCWEFKNYERYEELLSEEYIFKDNTNPADIIVLNVNEELQAAKRIFERFHTINMTIFITPGDLNDSINLTFSRRTETRFTGDNDTIFVIKSTEELEFVKDPEDSTKLKLISWISKAD